MLLILNVTNFVKPADSLFYGFLDLQYLRELEPNWHCLRHCLYVVLLVPSPGIFNISGPREYLLQKTGILAGQSSLGHQIFYIGFKFC